MAGEIDNLNFKVILNDKEFQTTIERDTRIAKQFNTTLSNILDVKAKGKGVSLFSPSTLSDIAAVKKGVQEILDKMGGIKDKAAEIKKEVKDSGVNMSEVKDRTAETKDLMNEVAKLTGIAFGGAQIKEFIGSLVRVSGEFETQKMALTSMLQSADDANMIFSTLRKNALESPYTFQDLTKYAKQLVAFNISTDKLIETEKMLADVAAGLDVDMGRIILAYGQVKAAGALKGQELRQFTEAGVPLLQSLADQIERTEGKAVSLAQVFNRISKKEIPFEMVEQAFKDMTAEGGKFYNMQEVLVETLKGKIGKLRDVWQQALYDMGNANSGYLKDAVDLLTRLVANMDKVGGIIKAIIVQYGAFAAILATIASGINLVAGAKTLANLGQVVRELKAVEGTMNGIAIASKAAKSASFALAALATAGFLVYDAIKKAHAAQERYDKTIATFNNSVAKEKQKLDELHKALVENKKGTKEWNAAKDEAVRTYGKYFNGLDQEITKVGNLSTAYDDLTSKIEASIAARTFADYYQAEKAGYDKQENDVIERIQKLLAARYGNNSLEYRAQLNRYMDVIQGNRGNARDALLQEFGGWPIDETFIRQLDKSYNEFWNKTKMAAERMGLDTGGNLFNPEALLISLAGGGRKNPTTQPTWGNEGWQNSDKVSKEQKARIKNIMAIQAAYKDLDKAGYSEEQINQMIDAEFAWVDEKIRSRRDFWEELKEEADAMKDANAANSLRGDIAKGEAKEAAEQKKAEIDEQKKAAKEAEKALERYQETLARWTQKDSSTTNKAVSAYRTELNKIANEYDDLTQKAKQAYPNVDELNNELARLAAIRQEKEGNARGKFIGNFKGMAKSLIDEGMYGYDMTNWADKDVAGIKRIGDALDALKIPDDVYNALAGDFSDPDWEENVEQFENAVSSAKDKLKQSTITPGYWKAVGKEIKKVSAAFNGVYDAAKEYAETVNPELAKSIELMEDTSKALADMASAAIRGDWLLVAAIGVAFLVEQIIRLQTETEKLNKQLREFQEEMRAANFQEALSNGVSSIFGTNDLASLENGLNGVADAMKRINELSAKQYQYAKKDWAGRMPSNRTDLEAALELNGLTPYDANGMWNVTALEKLRDLYGDNTGELQQLINAVNEYNDALKQVNSVMESLVGQIADDAADKIVNSWIEAGNAALDYAEILDDVARSYAKLVIKQLILESLPKDLASTLTQMVRDDNKEGFMAELASALSSIEQLKPYIEQALLAFDPYFLKDGNSSSSVGAGIKSITEDTANLLAAYINAIRADVAMGNTQRGEILSLFREYLNQEAAPSYAEYLAQIEAHTSNILETNRNILSELRSIITPESGLPAVRIQNA